MDEDSLRRERGGGGTARSGSPPLVLIWEKLSPLQLLWLRLQQADLVTAFQGWADGVAEAIGEWSVEGKGVQYSHRVSKDWFGMSAGFAFAGEALTLRRQRESPSLSVVRMLLGCAGVW